MHRFAQCTVIWKIYNNLVIHISRNQNDEIVELSLIQTSWIVSTIRRNYSVISYTTIQNVYLNYYQIIENYRHIICKTNLSNHSPFIHVCVNSLCRISTTGISMTSQRRCHGRDSQNHAQIFYNARFVAARFGNSLADFGFVTYQKEFIIIMS